MALSVPSSSATTVRRQMPIQLPTRPQPCNAAARWQPAAATSCRPGRATSRPRPPKPTSARSSLPAVVTRRGLRFSLRTSVPCSKQRARAAGAAATAVAAGRHARRQVALAARGAAQLAPSQEAGGGGGGGGASLERAFWEGVPPEQRARAEDLKGRLEAALQGVDRGIFGLQAAKKADIENLVEALEACRPLSDPTSHLDLVAGEWELLYSTITILGARRTKLGLREFVKLGAFRQVIDLPQKRALNIIQFSVAGFGLLKGSLTIEASYAIASPTRVNIQFVSSAIVPEQLLSLFQKNYNLLLAIFNPDGWLEITYLDQDLRVGRDNAGHVFLVRRL